MMTKFRVLSMVAVLLCGTSSLMAGWFKDLTGRETPGPIQNLDPTQPLWKNEKVNHRSPPLPANLFRQVGYRNDAPFPVLIRIFHPASQTPFFERQFQPGQAEILRNNGQTIFVDQTYRVSMIRPDGRTTDLPLGAQAQFNNDMWHLMSSRGMR